MADSGHGLSITFQSGFFAEITNVSHTGISRAALETTDSASSVKEYIPADLIDWGEIQVSLQFNPNATPPIDQAAESTTITFPVPAGGSSGATIAGSMFMTNFDWTAPTAQEEGIMTANATLKAAGALTWTDSA